ARAAARAAARPGRAGCRPARRAARLRAVVVRVVDAARLPPVDGDRPCRAGPRRARRSREGVGGGEGAATPGAAPLPRPGMTADLFVRGATVYPGDGPGGVLDVAVTGGVIEAVGPALAVEARETVEAAGLMLCPGFVDMHAHSALRSFSQPLLEPKIGQGFTTELINPDGLAPAPVAPERREERRAYLRGLEGDGPEEWGWSTFDEYLQALEATRPATTLVPSIGHSAVRDVVLGGDRRAPGAVELRRMRDEVRFGLEAGARTLSFGLLYLPGAYANTDELAALAEVAAEYGAPLVPHIRNEGLGVLGAAAEMLDVARRSGAPLHISHLKCLSDERLVEPLLALLPVWAQEGGASATLARLERPAERARIARDVEHGLEGWENFLGTAGPERIVIANAGPPNETAAGRSLAELAAERGQEPVEAVCSLLLESQLDVTMIEHYASDQTVKLVAAHRLHLVGSDGIFGAKP